MRFLILTVVLALGPLLAKAIETDYLEKVYQGQSSEKNPAIARREMLEEALEKTAEGVVTDLIGAEKFQRNKTTIRNDIVKQADKFIPFTKQSELMQDGDNWKSEVTLRVNMSELNKMLNEKGLATEVEGIPFVLPFVVVFQGSNKYSWSNFKRWQTDSDATKFQSFLMNQERRLSKAFSEVGFFVTEPFQNLFQFAVDGDFKATPQDLAETSKPWAPHLIIYFEISPVSQPEAGLQIVATAFQPSNAKIIGEVRKVVPDSSFKSLDPNDRDAAHAVESVSQELASQVLEVWQKGTIGTNSYRLAVDGKLDLVEQEKLKAKVLAQFRDIKAMRERALDRNQISYEIDSPLALSQLALKISDIQLEKKTLHLKSSSDSELVFEVVKKGEK